MNLSLDAVKSKGLRELLVAASKSRFFTISVFLHILLVVLLGGTVLFRVVQEPEDFEGEGGGLVDVSEAVNMPPVQTPTMPQTNPTITPVATSSAPSLKALTTINPSAASFTLPTIAPKVSPVATALSTAVSAPAPTIGNTGLTREVASGIKGFTGGWGKGSSGTGTGSMRQRAFEFTAYVAKYQGGDWASTVQIRDNKIVAGSLPNLLYLMREWSGDKIDANPQAEPLDLSSDAIFSVKPPFIFFTGHRDFTLTPKEVENLQKYVRVGGAIWGDSSLPGRRSRFDIAFRREMKRVVPDKDKDFEPIPNTHPIFTKTYWPEIRDVPPGLNYYQEPIYALRVYGEIAIFYTANDYGDMWQIGLKKDGTYDRRRDENRALVAINDEIFQRSDVYFRNLSEPALANSYKFGTNIVMHLLTRWEERLRTVPNL